MFSVFCILDGVFCTYARSSVAWEESQSGVEGPAWGEDWLVLMVVTGQMWHLVGAELGGLGGRGGHLRSLLDPGLEGEYWCLV